MAPARTLAAHYGAMGGMGVALRGVGAGSSAAVRRCRSCDEDRSVEHRYCWSCGALLGQAVVRSNRREKVPGMFWSRIITRQDVRGPALRTAGDRVAVALVNVELLGLAGLWVASKLWFPALHQLWLHLWASVMIGRWVPLSMHLVDCCTRP